MENASGFWRRSSARFAITPPIFKKRSRTCGNNSPSLENSSSNRTGAVEESLLAELSKGIHKNIWRAQGDDFRIFLRDFVSGLPQFDPLSGAMSTGKLGVV